ncbi:hypothetical protein ACQ4PT_005406 [Festuca glaucescens]
MEVVLSAATGDLVSRFFSFLMNKYSDVACSEEDNSLERLQQLLLRAHMVVEEADRRYIANSGMLRQLKMLSRAMYHGYHMLDTFKCNQLIKEGSKEVMTTDSFASYLGTPLKRFRAIGAISNHKPGLTGGSQDTYVRHMLLRARSKGWRVVVFNSRGCAGSPVTTAKCNIYAAGWSLGANILVRYLGEETDKCSLSGAVSMCNPFDLVIADEDFHKGFNNIYDRALANSLRAIFKKHALLFEGLDGEYNIPKAANAKTVRDFDEGLTRVSFGFKSVDDYYSNSSSSDSIKNVSIPLLCIQADNDPIAPSRGIPREDIKANPNCLLIVTPQGGHLGWVAGDEAPFGCPWTDPIVMEFLEHVQNEKSSTTKNSKPHEQQSVPQTSVPHVSVPVQR